MTASERFGSRPMGVRGSGGRAVHPVAPHRARVIVVDDEAPIAEMLSATLTFAGFDVRTALTCAEARSVAGELGADLAVLDVMLPDGSGFDLCRSLRADHPRIGVIFLTARDGIDDKLTGLALGGDDYITKPFSVADVVARLNGLLRRIGSSSPEHPPAGLQVGDLVMNDDSHRVTRAGEPVNLSPTEFKLLHYLMQNADIVVSKHQILSQVWRYDFGGDAAVVEKFISQLRRKIDRDAQLPLLHTVRGFGYVLRDPAA